MAGARAVGVSLALSAVLFASTAACGSTSVTPTSAPASTSPTIAPPSPTLAQPTPTRRTAETGVYPYDFGYNEAVSRDMRTPTECEYLARSLWDQIPESPDRESEFLTIYQGCVDGIFNRIPHATFPSEFPAGGVPFVDPCQEGNINPWIVIYDGPGGSGDISVGAPCQELAEQYALEQLPPGSFILDIFQA